MAVLNTADAVYVGADAADAVYLGGDLVWSGVVPGDPGAMTWTGAWEASQLTGSPADGTALATWNDVSGNARNMTQTVAGKKPLVKTGANGINGLPAVLFDGNDDSMDSAALLSAFITNAAFEWFVVAKITAIVGDSAFGYATDGIISETSGSGIGCALIATGPAVGTYNLDTGNGDFVTTAVTTGAPVVLHGRHAAGSIVVSSNGGTEASLASGNTSDLTGTLRFGANYADVLAFSGLLSAVYITDTALAVGDRAALISFLKTRYGAA